jgi:hypothetical protein
MADHLKEHTEMFRNYPLVAYESEIIEADDMDKRSSDSAEMLEYWEKSGDFIKGLKCVRDKGEEYLPKFPNENEKDYKFRLSISKLTNIYRDIVEGLASKPFEQEVNVVDAPATIEQFIENVDGSGTNATAFLFETFFNGINSAVDWIFVDFPSVSENNVKTLADEKALGIRPFWSHVLGRNVLEAKWSLVNGNEELTYVRILEPGKPNRVRVMMHDAVGARFEVWEETINKDTGKKTFVLINSGPITINKIPMVPFWTGRRDGKRYYFHPPMRDAVDLQVELYQQESALKYAKTMTAYPMLAGNGVTPETEADGKTPKPVSIGPGRVLYSRPNGNGIVGNWAFIEPTSTSLKFLADDIKTTGDQLRELGRQPLTAQSGNLTVITTAVAASKSRSAVVAWALNLKNAAENAFVITGMWLNEPYDAEVEVYTDFDDFNDPATDIQALQTMRAAKDLSQETYWLEMKRRKVLSAEFDDEEEVRRLLDEMNGVEETNHEPDSLDPEDPSTQPGNAA